MKQMTCQGHHETIFSGISRACVSLNVVCVFTAASSTFRFFDNMVDSSAGCLHHFNIIMLLLLLSMTLMAKSCSLSEYGRDPPLHSRRLLTSQDSWVPEEANWRAFMSKLPSTEEAHWRDSMSKVTTVGKVMQTKFLEEDGSMSEGFFKQDMELILPQTELETPFADYSNVRKNGAEEKLKDVVACKESMQDGLPGRQGTEPCLVTVPSHYARQYKWPLSQFKARVQNVPNSPLLKSRRSRAWVHVNASTIVFLAGGPMYPKGAESYVDHLMQLVPDLGVGTSTRVALDVECGTGSLSQALGKRGVSTLCLAAYDSLENGVQLVMERGFPGLLSHSLDSSSSGSGSQPLRRRLPFPSQAFDLLHCAACNVSWASHDGILLFEADRILRHGGFFVWIMDGSNLAVSWSDMVIQVEKLCWKLVVRNHQITVWRKPANVTSTICSIHTHVPLCSPAPESEPTWKVGMKPCVENTDDIIVAVDANWTWRLRNPPKRLNAVHAGGLQRAKQEVFISDFNYWVYVTDFYVRSLGSSRVADIRNVLDVNAGYGSFAAALAMRTPPVPWWVLSVVPMDQPDRLPILFDRGLLGLSHDWCEPLDSYARTFDLVHASRFFGIHNRCSAEVILVEMDRLLRPGGFVVFRDHKEVLLPLQKMVTKLLHWKAHIGDTESGQWGTDKLLHCQKTRWTHNPKP